MSFDSNHPFTARLSADGATSNGRRWLTASSRVLHGRVNQNIIGRATGRPAVHAVRSGQHEAVSRRRHVTPPRTDQYHIRRPRRTVHNQPLFPPLLPSSFLPSNHQSSAASSLYAFTSCFEVLRASKHTHELLTTTLPPATHHRRHTLLVASHLRRLTD